MARVGGVRRAVSIWTAFIYRYAVTAGDDYGNPGRGI